MPAYRSRAVARPTSFLLLLLALGCAAGETDAPPRFTAETDVAAWVGSNLPLTAFSGLAGFLASPEATEASAQRRRELFYVAIRLVRKLPAAAAQEAFTQLALAELDRLLADSEVARDVGRLASTLMSDEGRRRISAVLAARPELAPADIYLSAWLRLPEPAGRIRALFDAARPALKPGKLWSRGQQTTRAAAIYLCRTGDEAALALWREQARQHLLALRQERPIGVTLPWLVGRSVITDAALIRSRPAIAAALDGLLELADDPEVLDAFEPLTAVLPEFTVERLLLPEPPGRERLAELFAWVRAEERRILE